MTGYLPFTIYMLIDIEFGQKCYRHHMKGLLSMNYHRERKRNHEPFNDRARLSLKNVTTEDTFLTVLYF